MNVLVIPEDFRKDQYVLKPIVERMMRAIGYPAARVTVCKDPLLRGVDEALKWDFVAEILDRYRGMTRVFLLLVDRDCNEGRRRKLTGLETRAREHLGDDGRVFVAENAWQELEVWALAGLKDLPKKWTWSEVRADCHPKEAYYLTHAKKRGVLERPYQGRDDLAKEGAANYARIRQLCPEVARIESELRRELAR